MTTTPFLAALRVCGNPTCTHVGMPELGSIKQCPACHGPTTSYVESLPPADPPIVCPDGCTLRHPLGWDGILEDGRGHTGHRGPDDDQSLTVASDDGRTVSVEVYADHIAGQPADPWKVWVAGDAPLNTTEARRHAAAVIAQCDWIDAQVTR